MKNLNHYKKAGRLAGIVFAMVLLGGCGRKVEKESGGDIMSENIVITETGEVLEKEETVMTPVADTAPVGSATQTPQAQEQAQPTTAPTPAPTAAPLVLSDGTQVVVNEPEQVVTEEDQREPQGKDLQLVFLGDSIFDTSRDGTGIPYLTAVQCEADVYNLAIGGTRATIEYDEQSGFDNWTSTSLTGVVNAMMGNIPTDIFAGKVAKEILDNPNVDFSNTDYFIVEYGMNDFLSAAPLDSESGEIFNLRTYAGALRFAVTNLRTIAPDATIILCAPNYAQFYNGSWMIGDGNSINNGYGTLFDYKGICEYVSNEYQTLFLNAYQDLGIDGYSAERYLEDGVHLTAEGRQVYADALARLILSYEETKNN